VTPRDLTALRRAAEHVLVRRDVRVAGIAAATFGALAGAMSSLPPASPPLQISGILVGAAGVWCLLDPRPIGLRAAGIGLSILGGVHLAAGAVTPDASAAAAGQILGFWQLAWGIQCLLRHRRFAGPLASAPATDVADAARVLSELRRARPRTSPDVIQFEIRGWLPVLAWARLTPDAAVCLIGGADVCIVPRDSVDMEVMGEARGGTAVHVRVRLADRVIRATIRKELLERFEVWKGDLAHPESIAA